RGTPGGQSPQAYTPQFQPQADTQYQALLGSLYGPYFAGTTPAQQNYPAGLGAAQQYQGQAQGIVDNPYAPAAQAAAGRAGDGGRVWRPGSGASHGADAAACRPAEPGHRSRGSHGSAVASDCGRDRTTATGRPVPARNRVRSPSGALQPHPATDDGSIKRAQF